MASQDLSVGSSPTVPTKLIEPIGFDGTRFIYDKEGAPYEEPLTPRRAKRQAEALAQSIFFNSTDKYYDSTEHEPASKFIEELEKTLGIKIYLKGSWTNRELKPNDLDFGAWIFEAPPGYESVIRQQVLSLLIARVKRVYAAKNEKEPQWVPLSAYLTEEVIYDKQRRVKFILYRGLGIDVTFYLFAERFSPGKASGCWWSTGPNPVERISKGKTFNTEKDLAKKTKYLIQHHLDEIDEPATIHNWHLLFSYGMLRQGQLVDKQASIEGINSLFKEKSVQQCAQKLARFQEDHLQHDESKILHLLLYYTLHAFNQNAWVFITNVWQKACELQKIDEMDPFCNVIAKNRQLIPHVLSVIRWALLAKGADAYKFDFNEPNTLRPFLGVKVKDTVNYLLLPNNDSTPIHLGRQFLKSRAYLLPFAKELKPIFRGLGLSTKYLSNKYNFDDMRAFYASPRARNLQALFGPYPEASSFLKELPAQLQDQDSSAGVPIKPLQPGADFAHLAAGTTVSQAASPELPLSKNRSKGPILALMPPKDDSELIGCDLQSCKAIATTKDIKLLLEVVKLVEALTKIKQSDEKTVKLVYGLITNIRQRSEDILAGKEKLPQELGPNYFKEFISQHFAIILEKTLAYPTPELFEVAYNFFSSWSPNLTEAVEQEAVLCLIKAWMKLSPQKDSRLHNQGKELISLAFKKNITGDNATFNAAFEVLASSTDSIHLRLAYSALNHLLLNFESDPDPKVVERIIVLLTTTLKNEKRELYRPLFRTILKLYNYDRAGFKLAFAQIKAILLPDLMHAIKLTATGTDFKYNGDERLLFKTLDCLQTFHTDSSLPPAVQAFDTIIAKGQAASLTQLALIGDIACSLIRTNEQLGSKIEWKDDQMRQRWLALALKLQAVTEEEAGSCDEEVKHFEALASELMAHFKKSWTDKEFQDAFTALRPKKAVVIKKDEKVSKETHRVVVVADLLLKTLQNPITEDAQKRIARIVERSKALLAAIQKESISKELHAKLSQDILQVHCLLSNEKHAELPTILHEIFLAASSKGLLEVDTTPYVRWVINCQLKNIDKNFDLKQMQRIITLALALYTKTNQNPTQGIPHMQRLVSMAKDLYAQKTQKPAQDGQENKIQKDVIELVFEVYKVLNTRFPDQKEIKPVPFFILVRDYLKAVKDHPQPDYALLFTFLESVPFKPEPETYKQLFSLLEQLVQLKIPEKERRLLIRLIRGVMKKTSIDFNHYSDEFVRFAYAILQSNYNKASPELNPNLPVRTKVEILACLCVKSDHQQLVIKELNLSRESPDVADQIHRNLVHLNRTFFRTEKFFFPRVLNLYDFYIRANPNLPVDKKNEIHILALKHALLNNDIPGFLALSEIVGKDNCIKAIDSPALAINFLKFFLFMPFHKLKDGIPQCFHKAMECCKDTDSPDARRVIQQASKVAYSHMVVIERKLLDNAFIELNITAESLLKFIDSFYTPLAAQFPEKARKFLPNFLDKLVTAQIEVGWRFDLINFFHLFDKYQIYTKKSGEILPVNLSPTEQEEVNKLKLAFLRNMIFYRLAVPRINPTTLTFQNEDVFQILSYTRQLWFCDQDPVLFDFIIDTHKKFADHLANQSLMTCSTNDLERYFFDIYSFMEQMIIAAKKFRDLKPSTKLNNTKATNLLDKANTFWSTLRRQISSYGFMPDLYHFLNTILEKDGVPLKKRSQLNVEQGEMYATHLAAMSKRAFPGLPVYITDQDPYVDVSNVVTEWMSGIYRLKNIDLNSKLYANAISEQAKTLVHRLSLALTAQLIQKRVQLFSVVYDLASSNIAFGSLEMQTIAWMRIITGKNISEAIVESKDSKPPQVVSKAPKPAPKTESKRAAKAESSPAPQPTTGSGKKKKKGKKNKKKTGSSTLAV